MLEEEAMEAKTDYNFYLHDAVHILRSNGTVEHADACEWAVGEIERLREVASHLMTWFGIMEDGPDDSDEALANEHMIAAVKVARTALSREWDHKLSELCGGSSDPDAAASANSIEQTIRRYERALEAITELSDGQPARSAWNMVHLARAALTSGANQ